MVAMGRAAVGIELSASERRELQSELWPKLGDGGVRKAAYRGG